MAGEIQVQKSPAEFFAEHQAIAGFDNLGKSLYTSLRELVENALDACESIHALPEISVEITEYTQKEFNQLEWGLKTASPTKRKDTELFVASSSSKKADSNKLGDSKKSRKEDAYFEIRVRDNGCGMKHASIPHLLGRVLSGSKYGVRQTRGKFGLGAKMALIWSKKSSGQPICIRTSHRPSGGDPAPYVSECILDIDIYKNEPKVLSHTKEKNTDGWIGTEMSLLIAGNWTTYKSRIVQYLQQLAIITPYAILDLSYANLSEPHRNVQIHYDRRSEQMPPPAQTVKHHPSSVNNLVVQELIRLTKTKTMVKFLSHELAQVSPAMAQRLLTEIGLEEDEHPQDLGDKQITRLVQLLRQVQLFKNPDGSCLSPLGEYNLNLGIRQVLEPEYVATARDKASAYEGHPFVVEAAVSLGGPHVKEGITVLRFANRIPLLFEGGADVATRVAMTKIRWANYKIDHKRDKIGVFVSIVSTKIPFKGTSKEYIGDECTEIQQSVKRTLQSCCQQLRTHLAQRNALKDAKERHARLAKYVPDVGRALYGILDGMRKRRAEEDEPAPVSSSPTKRLRMNPSDASTMIRKLARKEVTESSICDSLRSAIETHVKTVEANEDSEQVDLGSKTAKIPAIPIYLIPLYNLDDPSNDIEHELFTFRPILPIQDDTKSDS